jgi:hypothetical protein
LRKYIRSAEVYYLKTKNKEIKMAKESKDIGDGQSQLQQQFAQPSNPGWFLFGRRPQQSVLAPAEPAAAPSAQPLANPVPQQHKKSWLNWGSRSRQPAAAPEADIGVNLIQIEGPLDYILGEEQPQPRRAEPSSAIEQQWAINYPSRHNPQAAAQAALQPAGRGGRS